MAFLWFMIYYTLCSLFSTTISEQINSLPGQTVNVTFKQFSGYIVSDDYYGRSLFYYFVEAQSKRSPTLLPLTLWLGGAHGCSSSGNALFTENGPFRPAKDGKLILNPFSWNLVSNMLYVDSPIGTGFSFSNTDSDYTKWNHSMTVHENMKFVLKWFEKFPKYRNSDFYLAGDGSAGHLIPQLAALMLEYNQHNDAMPIKLKGIALGNPGMGTPGIDTADYLWYHGVISQELYTMLKTVCSYAKQFYEGHHGKFSKDCQIVSDKMDEELGEDFEMDSLLSPNCVPSNSVASDNIIGSPCLSQYASSYLNKREVQKAVHVNKTRLPYNWDICQGALKVEKDAYDTKNFHTLATLLKRRTRILFYSGDQDVSVPVVETRKFAQILAEQFKLVHLQKNRPWYNGFQVGGWSDAFGKLREGKNVTYLTFASVKGGSHFVPLSSPSEVLILFKSFLRPS